jgi:protein CpxP
MTKTKLLNVAVAALVLINLALLAVMLVKHPPPPNQEPEQGPRQMISQLLHFDAAQEAAYGKLVEQHQDQVRLLEDSIRQTKTELYSTLDHDADTTKYTMLHKLNGFQLQMESMHYDHFEAIKKLCHPDQLPAYRELTTRLAALFTPRGRQAGAGHPPPPMQ